MRHHPSYARKECSHAATVRRFLATFFDKEHPTDVHEFATCLTKRLVWLTRTFKQDDAAQDLLLLLHRKRAKYNKPDAKPFGILVNHMKKVKSRYFKEKYKRTEVTGAFDMAAVADILVADEDVMCETDVAVHSLVDELRRDWEADHSPAALVLLRERVCGDSAREVVNRQLQRGIEGAAGTNKSALRREQVWVQNLVKRLRMSQMCAAIGYLAPHGCYTVLADIAGVEKVNTFSKRVQRLRDFLRSRLASLREG